MEISKAGDYGMRHKGITPQMGFRSLGRASPHVLALATSAFLLPW